MAQVPATPALVMPPTAISRSPLLSNSRPLIPWSWLRDDTGNPVINGCAVVKFGPVRMETWPLYGDGPVKQVPLFSAKRWL